MKSNLTWTERIVMGIVLVIFAAALNYSHITQRIDNAIFDIHLGLWSRQKSEDIVLVTIDSQSLEQLGRWPWSRRFHAKLLDVLKNSKAVGFDIFFSEADLHDPEGDQIFADTIKKHGRVVLPVTLAMTSAGTAKAQLYELSSLPLFGKVAAGQGHVDVELDSDGLSRSIFLEAGMGRPERKAFPLVIAELDGQIELTGEKNKNQITSSDDNVWVRDHRILLPLTNVPDYFQKISFVNAIDPEFDRSLFENKWILVGMDAIGLGDRIATPVTRSSQPMSGVEFEAQVLDILLNKISIEPLDDHRNFLLTLPFILALLLLFNLFRSDRAWLATFFPLLATLLFGFYLSRIGFSGEHYWFRPGPALVSLLLGYALLHRHQLAAFISSLTKEKEHAEVAMNTVSDAIVITDKSGRIEFMNPNAEALTGHLLKNVRGQPLAEIMSVQDAKGMPYPIDLVTKSLVTNSSIELPANHFLKQRDGHLLPLRACAKPFVDYNDKISGVIIAFDELKTNEPGSSTSLIDELTHLPAQSLLYDRLGHAISNANRTKRLISVLYIDLNDFNKVNDAFGSENGDSVLKEIAHRLTLRGRTGDTIARVGEDEFAVVLENLEDTDPVASVATALLDAIKEPFKLDDHEVRIDASIGISIYPKDGMDPATLKNNAYTAMKRAKKSRRHDIPRFRFYSQKMNKSALDHLLSEKDLRNALNEKNFELYYQPRVNFNTGQIVAVEALIRWHHPGKGLVMPTSFIPLAERSGLITDIGAWVLQTACDQAKAWETANLMQPRMAINLSPRQFMQHDLLDTITRVLDAAELEPRFLELEITENTLVRDADRCIEILKEFREVGGMVSIDDFGTGYSSLSYLKNFPVDILKIDKVFTKDITTESDHAAITLAVISMAHSLNLEVVAEGVENEAQFNFLRARGCDELQGYFFSKPVPADEMTSMLHQKRRLETDDVLDNAATTLLLVDDDYDMLTSMGVMLRNEGYRILMAGNGTEALDLIARHPVGVVVCDEVMPGMRGSEFLGKIKNLYPKTIRILLSATADREAIITAINSGAIFKYLSKPIIEQKFKNSLKEGFRLYNRG